jgi:predicted permease
MASGRRNPSLKPRPPLLGRLILRFRRLGARRSEIEADLGELHRTRTAERGRGYATLRYCLDAASLWIHRTKPQPVVVSRRRAPLEGLLLDLRFAVRMFRRQIGVVSVTVFGLALAIGTTTVIFGYFNAVMLRPFGGADSASVVQLRGVFSNGSLSAWWPYAEYEQLRERSRSSRLEAYLRHEAPFGDGQQEVVAVTLVNGTFFQTFGVRAAAGRLLTPADDTPVSDRVVAVNYGFWQRRLGGDESIVGQTVRLMGEPFTVIGVVEEDFGGPLTTTPAFWVPLALAMDDPAWNRDPGWGLRVEVYGRIDEAATHGQAVAEASALVAAVSSERLRGDAEQPPRAELAPVDERLSLPWARWFLATIIAVLGLVLLIACSNVANVLLAGAITRRREVGMRLALGASRGRVMRQLLSESVLLSALSGGLGLLFTVWFMPLLALLVEMPPTLNVKPDIRVYGFLTISTLAAGIVAGLAPARYGGRGDLAAPLKGDAAATGGSGRPGRARSTLVGIQAAASILLLVLAALLTRSMMRVMSVDLGFDEDRLLMISANFDAGEYDAPRAAAYWDQATDRLSRLPGVERAAVAYIPPFALGSGYGPGFPLEGGGDRQMVFLYATSPDYFATAGIRILRGRTYSAQEVASNAPVALIADGLARRLWPDSDPLGATLERVSDRLADVRVIGIAADAITNRPQLEAPYADSVYQPLAPGDRLRAYLVVRSRGDVDTIIQPVIEAVRALDPELLPIATPLRDRVGESLRRLRTFLLMAAMLGAIAVGLAITGVFGLTAFAVEQRTGEIGVRVALGASRRDVVRLMLRDSLRPVIAGLAVGLLGALAATRILTSYLYGLSPRDPVAMTGAVVILLGAAALAASVPTRRATLVDPAEVLRRE